MPADADLLLDTSAAVALMVADHTAHEQVRRAVGDATLGLSGHAAFETFSVLSRLPSPLRRTPKAVQRLIDENFPASRFLDDEATARLLSRLGDLGLGGGAVYDALVGASAVHHELPLATRDRRALETYRRLGVTVQLL